MKRTARTHRRGPRKWRESFTVWIDFLGDRSQIGPLLDHIAGCQSDGGGSFTALPLSDQSWTLTVGQYPKMKGIGAFRAEEVLNDAELIFERLRDACKDRWSPYIRLRLLHDDKPDRCGEVEKPEGIFNRRGPLVLRKYQRGKAPSLKAFLHHKPKLKPRRKSA